MNQNYRLEKAENGYFILNGTDKPLMTHCGNPYPALPEEPSRMLLNDLNEVTEVRDSFIYCTLSTLIEMPAQNYTISNDPNPQIQWDGAYRVDPNPEAMMLQIAVIAPVQKLLGDKWEDLPLNYCNSLENMKEEEVPFVSGEIVDVFAGLSRNMNQMELFCITLLNQYFGGRNYSMCVLWVLGKVSNYELIHAGFHLGGLKSNPWNDRFTKAERTEMAILDRRLEKLKEFLSSFYNFTHGYFGKMTFMNKV